MHSKRQMLEDIFKVSLPCNDRGHVDIATARSALEEHALKSWQNHLGEPADKTATSVLGSDLSLQSFREILKFWCKSFMELLLKCFKSV